MATHKQSLLHALDIPVWLQRRSTSVEANVPSELPVQVEESPLNSLRQCVADCQRCPLHATRTQTVFGVGNEKAKLMIIGEAPGFYEDQQGEPFVGRAGQLLNAMLQSVGFSRSEVYIANILKCRPPNNRDPVPTEVLECTPYLQEQIQLIQPKVLCAVGRIAGHYLLNSTESLSHLRNKVHRYGDNKLPLVITYHPAYLLRNPSAKAEAYQDLLNLKNLV